MLSKPRTDRVMVADTEHNKEFEDLLELHFFEIGKALKFYKNDKKHKWMKLISADSIEALE